MGRVCLAVGLILTNAYLSNAWSGVEIDRRGAIATAAGSLSAAIATGIRPVVAGGSALKTFEDEVTGISLDVPVDWVASVQELPDRRKMNLWKDPDDTESLVFIAYTPVRDDFTSLGSFGTADVVAAQTIMPKAKIAGFDVEAEMLSAVSAKRAYFFDYLQTVPGVQPTTHFRTIFTLRQGATGGAGAVLVTVTAQTAESRYRKELEGVFDRIINSFHTIP